MQLGCYSSMEYRYSKQSIEDLLANRENFDVHILWNYNFAHRTYCAICIDQSVPSMLHSFNRYTGLFGLLKTKSPA